jgi:hypothetical protein
MKKSNLVVILLFIFKQNIAQTYNWSELGIGNNSLKASSAVFSISSDSNNNIYASGGFVNSAGKFYVAKFNGTNWSEIKSGNSALNADDIITTIAIDSKGILYAGGEFKDSNGRPYIAKWNGLNWSKLNNYGGVFSRFGSIRSIKLDSLDNLYVAAAYESTSSDIQVAKWNGTSWSLLGTGSNGLNAQGEIHSMCFDNKGNLYVSGPGLRNNSTGYFFISKWNGINWTQLGSDGADLKANRGINVVYCDKIGNVYAGGDFTNSSGKQYVAKWNGNSWIELSGLNANAEIMTICEDKLGNIIAAGMFYNKNFKTMVAKRIGSNWTELGPGYFQFLSQILNLYLDNLGNIYAGGGESTLGGFVYKYGLINLNYTDELAENNQLLIYPNPTFKQLTIKSSPSFVGKHFSIMDETGRVLVFEKKLHEESILDLSSLKPGFYYLKFEDNFYSSMKILKY